MNTSALRVAAMALALLLNRSDFAGQYFQDFSSEAMGEVVLSDGTRIFSGGNVSIQDTEKKELKIPAGGPTTILLPEIEPARISAFSLKCSVGLPANLPEGPGGIAFSCGSADDLSFRIESGVFQLHLRGRQIAAKTFVPGAQWGALAYSPHYLDFDWNYTNGVSVRINGGPIFTKVPTTGVVALANRFAIRSLGAHEMGLDNIALVTAGNLELVTLTGAFASERNPDYGPRKAYDDDNESEFAVFSHSGFVGGNASGTRKLAFYAVTSGIDAPDPHNWTIQGGPNSNGPWTALATGDWNFSRRNETRILPISGSGSFPTFRTIFDANNSPLEETYIGDIRLYEFKAVTPPRIDEIKFVANGKVQLTFTGPVGIKYFAQFAPDLNGAWTDFGGGEIPALGGVTVEDVYATDSLRYYRLRQ